MKNTKAHTLAKAALIAAAYVALTWMSEALGLGFGAVQLRLSEALTILPVFTPAAIPGLILGCAVSNAGSPLGPVDMVVGTAATLLQVLCTRRLRNVKIKNIPFLSLLIFRIVCGREKRSAFSRKEQFPAAVILCDSAPEFSR